MSLEGMIWITRTGAPWRDLPKEFGNWNTVHRRFRRWVQSGVRETEETKRSGRRSLMPKRVWIPAGILLGAMTGIPTLMMGVAALDTQPAWVGAAYIAIAAAFPIGTITTAWLMSRERAG